MRFIHIADLHLGFRPYERENDFTPFLSLQFAVQYAVEKGIKLFIIAGDIFDRRDPPAFIQRGFAHIVKELVQNGVKVFIITGNHEGAPNPRRDIHLDLYDELEIEGVVIAKKIGYYRLDSLNIITVPYPFKRNLLARDEYREKSEKEIGHIMNEKIFGGIDYFLEKIDRKFPTVLVAHLPLSEGEVGEEKYTYFATDVPVSTEQLDRKEFSYIAMGHFHKMQIISTKKFGHPVVYPGSLDRINFGEEADKKGFFDVEIPENMGKTSFIFVENPFARKFYTIRIKNDGDINTVQWGRAKESIVRIILSGDLQNEKLFKKLADRVKKEAKIFAGMEDRRAVQNNIVRSNMSLSISPEEAVGKYIERQDNVFVKKHGEEIFKRAISFLKEE
jgi:exonuclease SbcD